MRGRIEFYLKSTRQLWLRSNAWWWDELVEWRKWEETGTHRENPRTRGEHFTTEPPRPH